MGVQLHFYVKMLQGRAITWRGSFLIFRKFTEKTAPWEKQRQVLKIFPIHYSSWLSIPLLWFERFSGPCGSHLVLTSRFVSEKNSGQNRIPQPRGRFESGIKSNIRTLFNCNQSVNEMQSRAAACFWSCGDFVINILNLKRLDGVRRPQSIKI